MLNTLLLASTIVGCLIVTLVSISVFRRKKTGPLIGWFLLVALVLCVFPVATAMVVAWKDKIVRSVGDEVSQRIASQAAQLNSELHDTAAKPPKPPSPEFTQNRAFTVLVFYHNHDDRVAANKLKDGLLEAGYRASASQSDFASWNALPSRQGQVRIIARPQLDTAAIRVLVEKSLADRKSKTMEGEGRLIEGDFHIRLY